MIFTQALALAHPAGSVLAGGTLQSGVGFQPAYDTEGKFEALEFSAGNYGLLESAYDVREGRDAAGGRSMTGARSSSDPITTTFQFVNEPSVIRYTTDGSKPTSTSTLWDSTGPREPGQSSRQHDDHLQVAGDGHQGQHLDRAGEVPDQVTDGSRRVDRHGGPLAFSAFVTFS